LSFAFFEIEIRLTFILLGELALQDCNRHAKKNRAAQPLQASDAVVNQDFIKALGFADT
jgi:hypothetical protein